MRRVLVLLLLITPAWAQDLPKGLGHPKDGEPDPYAQSCCHGQHCEPVEVGAIVETPDGYEVLYKASRGFIAKGFVKKGTPGVLQSFDGREHACATAQTVKCVYVHFGV
jgi:hypothetical protein